MYSAGKFVRFFVFFHTLLVNVYYSNVFQIPWLNKLLKHTRRAPCKRINGHESAQWKHFLYRAREIGRREQRSCCIGGVTAKPMQLPLPYLFSTCTQRCMRFSRVVSPSEWLRALDTLFLVGETVKGREASVYDDQRKAEMAKIGWIQSSYVRKIYDA